MRYSGPEPTAEWHKGVKLIRQVNLVFSLGSFIESITLNLISKVHWYSDSGTFYSSVYKRIEGVKDYCNTWTNSLIADISNHFYYVVPKQVRRELLLVWKDRRWYYERMIKPGWTKEINYRIWSGDRMTDWNSLLKWSQSSLYLYSRSTLSCLLLVFFNVFDWIKWAFIKFHLHINVGRK